MPRKVTRGTGITAYEHTVYDMREVTPELFRGWNRTIEEGGGIFGAVSLRALRTCEKILADAADEFPLEDSAEWFARRIVGDINLAKRELEAGNADLAARFAFDAGMQWAKACMKWAWEADAMRGEKNARDTRHGADETSKLHAATRERRLARMHELVQRFSVTSAARQCETEGLGSQEAIRKQWGRWKEKQGHRQ